ncbi:DUF4174 domain-containing protein [Hymenobacter chitinivorans]|uniref:Uncharacterized protein DUF4174 n=1 Tax=Hymenobacter chitinivorans DSM 11115 TaxID=1121954 RepID=A0A2M9AQ24_9BACT|nr:DUF4174 domain-containing protein [Hymenobacter chitinivorans]PJJ47789.1 uncharacterized protein DUF4174 [Hymenobacter chitinivorans DSM 11115]
MGLSVLRGLLVLSSFILWSTLVSAQAVGSLAASLKASRWQKRVLLLCAPTSDNAALLRQRQLLATDRPGLQARELLVREVLFATLSAADRNYLTETLHVSPTRFTMVLLGKDGGSKRRETEPVTPASLFTTIDAMPMRQREMQGNKPR